MKILVTGGAGYIGSHTVKLLSERGYDVRVFDNLSTGSRRAVQDGRLIEGDMLNICDLRDAFSRYRPDAVVHFAAKIIVPESVQHPLKYYTNNVLGTLNVLRVMEEYGVGKFIFSSTAAVYGEPENVPIAEDAPLAPINPYGSGKAVVEGVLRDISLAGSLKYVALRYFNVAGADPGGTLGETKEDATHLITMCVRAAAEKRDKLFVFGTDYPTADGTCIRDYIHVTDLAKAHVLALEHLFAGGASNVFNCGYGKGFSVKEIVDEAKKVTGVDFSVELVGRRAGDPAELVADSSKIKETLKWEPEYDDIGFIIKTAWEWEKKGRA